MKLKTVIFGLVGIGFWIWAILGSIYNYTLEQQIYIIIVASFISLGVKIDMLEERIFGE